MNMKHLLYAWKILMKFLCIYLGEGLLFFITLSLLFRFTVRVLILAQPNFSGNGWK